MSRALVRLWGDTDRKRVANWAWDSPAGTRVEFKGPRRSLPQNDRLWAMLTDIATQKDWHGTKLTTDDWKLIFIEALNRETRLVPNLDGDGFVRLGRSSSDLSKEEMSNLLALVEAWGAQNGVEFHDQEASA